MIVSFDLDETLFVNPAVIETEKDLKFPKNLIFKDKLRLGTVEFLLKIRSHDIKLWIYTTSFRSEKYIRAFFKCYGITLDNIINGERHQKEVQRDRLNPLPSKYPAYYRIDLHVDDEKHVFQNGQTYGFKVYLLKENDPDWHIKLWNEIERIKRNK